MTILNSTDDSFFEEDLYRTYETRQTSLFNRTFKQNEYFYCKNCKQYTFINKNGACLHNNSYCSYLTLEKSIFYLGDIDKDYPKSEYSQNIMYNILSCTKNVFAVAVNIKYQLKDYSVWYMGYVAREVWSKRIYYMQTKNRMMLYMVYIDVLVD